MGNCCHRCFGITDQRRKYTPSQYAAEQDFSIENYYMDDGFESLISEEPLQNETTRLLTDRERQLISTKQFDVLVHEQGKVDEELQFRLAQQEQEIEREEEAVYKAKRETARKSRISRDKPDQSKNNSNNWVNEDEWEIAGTEEDDFDQFLAGVRARVLSMNTQGEHSNDSTPENSPKRSSTYSQGSKLAEESHFAKDQSHRKALSLQAEIHAVTSHENTPDLFAMGNGHSNDQDWEMDFVSVEDDDKTRLLNTAASSSERETTSS